MLRCGICGGAGVSTESDNGKNADLVIRENIGEVFEKVMNEIR